MKPNKITPDIVRWVLGYDKFPETPKIQINNKWIGIEYPSLEVTPTGDILNYGREIGTLINPDFLMTYIDIHRFIYLAIEKCAAEGVNIATNLYKIQNGDWVIGNVKIKSLKGRMVLGGLFDFGKHQIYPDMLHAQLAAIAWVYGKIQEGK